MDYTQQKATFGKHKGKMISWIVDNDPNYAKWLATKSNSNTKTKRAAQSYLDTQK